jgi:uncharacterized protein YndB with AHSA1/START domain
MRAAFSSAIAMLRRVVHSGPHAPAGAQSLGRIAVVHCPQAIRSYDDRMSRTDTASRVIAAPPDRVYAAFVDEDALLAWLPPRGMSGRFEHFDPRPGGSYRLVLTYDDAPSSGGKATADSDVVEARFVDLVPGVRVVQAADFVSDDAAYAGTMTMTWEVAACDGGTRVDITAVDVPNGISPQDHATGLTSSLANLAEYLEQKSRRR